MEQINILLTATNRSSLRYVASGNKNYEGDYSYKMVEMKAEMYNSISMLGLEAEFVKLCSDVVCLRARETEKPRAA